MNKIRKILSIITVLTFFLLFSISPALAEEASGFTDGGAGAATTTEVIDEGTGTAEETTDAIEDSTGTVAQPEDESSESVDNDVLNVIVPITAEETTDIIEDSAGTAEETTDVIEDSTGTNEAAQPEEEGTEYLDSDVLNVIVPITVSVTIDPLELAGKGQIYSNIYKIKNYGDTDVLLTFTDIQVTFADDANFEALAQPFNERIGSNLKSIFMMLDFGRDDVPPAIITDPSQKKEISIPLSATQDDTAEDSLVQFNFSGNVNEASALSWQDNDVKISLNYTLETVPPPVEEVTPPAIEVTPPAEEIPSPATEIPPPVEEVTPPAEEITPPAEEVTPESVSPEVSPPEPSESPEPSTPPEPSAPSDTTQGTQENPS